MPTETPTADEARKLLAKMDGMLMFVMNDRVAGYIKRTRPILAAYAEQADTIASLRAELAALSSKYEATRATALELRTELWRLKHGTDPQWITAKGATDDK